MDKELLGKLVTAYPDRIEDIELLVQYIDTVEDHVTQELMAELIEKAQQIVNHLWTIKEDDVLIDVQVLLNELRNKYDVTDPREIINWDNGRGFVQ